MKKIIYCIAILGTVFIGCNPMEDIYKDIDAIEKPIIGTDTYTLTSEDYDDLELPFGSFNSEDDAKTMLPPFLAEMYPYWGKGSSVSVGYKLFIGNAEGVSDYTGSAFLPSGNKSYNLSMDDYALSGSDVLGFYPSVDAEDYLADILAAGIATPTEGQIALTRYIQFTEVPVITSTNSFSLEENFDYGGSAGDLTTVSGGTWEAHSGAGVGPIGYATSSLSMTDYPTSGIGGSATLDAAGSEDITSWFPEISSGTVYTSALVNLSTVSTGTYSFHLRDGEFNYRARVGAMDNGSGKILFGIGASSSTLVYGSTPFDLNTTYLLVASYNIDSGVSNLYVLSAVTATEPGTPEATDTTGSPGTIISGVSFRQAGGGPTGTFDGVRVSNTWDGIMDNFVTVLVEGDRKNVEVFYTNTGGTWAATQGVYFLQDSDYDSMGEGVGQPGQFNNFGSSTPAEDYLPTFLSLTSPWAYGLDGDEVIMVYDYFSSTSGAGIRGNSYTKINGEWTPHSTVIDTSLQFGHDGNTWVPDNTIRYNLTGSDIAFISNAFISIYPGPAANVLQFGSFDRRSSSGNYWSDEMLLEAFNALLENGNFITTEEQKYVLTYIVYTGATGPETKFVIKTGGAWVYQ